MTDVRAVVFDRMANGFANRFALQKAEKAKINCRWRYNFRELLNRSHAITHHQSEVYHDADLHFDILKFKGINVSNCILYSQEIMGQCEKLHNR